MSNALLTDVQARAIRRQTQTNDDRVRTLVEQSWDRAMSITDPVLARPWLERAHRMAPQDGMIACRLAGNWLGAGEWSRAAGLFAQVAERHGLAEAWAGLAACAHLLGRPDQARIALAAALRLRAPDAALIGLAQAVAAGGWCGLSPSGVLHAGPGAPAAVSMDGVPLMLRWAGGAAPLPEGWRRGGAITVTFPAGEALGSPLPLAAFAGLEGFVQAEAGGLSGWAWCPADPALDPVVHAAGPLGTRRLVLDAPADQLAGMRPLARPRRLGLDAAAVLALGTPIALRGPDGRHLLGSPLDPEIEAQAGFTPIWADRRGGPPAVGRRRPVDVVIPVYRGCAETLACLDSVLDGLARGTRVVVVDDASPDPQLVDGLLALARQRRITLIRLAENTGFPGAANAGLRAAAGRDAVLLNSDTLVPPGWLERLRAAAYSAPDIGTATPLTNDGTILSYPDPAGGNPMPGPAGTRAADALAQAANGASTLEIPVGVGFCLYLRRDCLDQVGLLREDLFAQGYGEENDLCLRARHHGWRNVAAAGVFVAHAGATSFGGAREHLVRRNAAILARLHPGYDALIAAHLLNDPLRPARHRMDALRWDGGRQAAGAVVMVTHAGGGGVDQVVADRAAAARRAGLRPIVLRPCPGGVRVTEAGGPPTPNLVFPLPAGLADLVRLLRRDRPLRVELHHMLGHDAALAGLAARLRVPAVSVVHDYARFCPRIALVSTERRYCGEPDVPGCEACVADLGSLLEDDPPVRTLLARSAAELGAATAVIAPSHDAAARMARHFPGIAAAVELTVEPWGDDARLPPLTPAPGPVRCVVVVGAIGVEKGFEALLACVRDARDRALALRFVVVGYTMDDERLLAAGPVSVTGQYAEADAPALIRDQGAQVALIPSLWPETWCFALSRVWEAGLAAAVFDLGAQAERVRRTGRGWLLPLGLSAPRINDALLRLAPDRPAGQSPPTFL